MTDHLEQAAGRAIELAEELVNDEGAYAGVRIPAAGHLTYLAGLIRGGVQPAERAVVVDCPTHGLRAFLLSGSEVMCGNCRVVGPDRKPLGWDDGRPTETSDDDPIETVHLGWVTFGGRTELDELRRQADLAKQFGDDVRQRWRQAADQRDALAQAARDVLDSDFGTHNPVTCGLLRQVVERIERQSETPAEGAARLQVE
jgi:hypothetical protein